ncbi:MAG TPA: prepilin-type N-terminal cleavage/methylation domain-containing protein [Candidatus Paceibacterota bacterium]|nr:prepilin-type N-terminal cleavage/methylation domain-containing protein [Candidatus Paceibacterota bacterium]
MRYEPTHRGYSLLEMMVAIGLFSLVMLLATGAFLKFMSLERVARYTNDVTTNLSFAIDSMSRSIRTGTDYMCGGDLVQGNCWPSGLDRFSFRDDQGRLITYLLKENGSLGRCTVAECSDSQAIDLTDKRITIQNLKFYVQGVGADAGDPEVNFAQPQVLISIQGTMRPEPDQPPVSFTIQTMATQRLLELPL